MTKVQPVRMKATGQKVKRMELLVIQSESWGSTLHQFGSHGGTGSVQGYKVKSMVVATI